MSKPIDQFRNFEYGKKLKYWDKDKVLLASFVPKGKDKEVRFFRKKPENYLSIMSENGLTERINKDNISEFVKENGMMLQGFDVHQNIGKHLLKIPSRTVLSEIREPFVIEPWNQCLIDYAVKYGSLIDDDKEDYLFEKKDGSEILNETKLSLAKILQLEDEKLIWASRSQMVCHPDASVYGEIDEIWYDEKNDIYYIGDTKTSSKVNKLSYWYQLGVYIEVVRSLNPELANKISSTAIIQWIRIKKEKWSLKPNFNDKDDNGEFISPAKKYEYSKWILDNMEGKRPDTITKAQNAVYEIEEEFIKPYLGKDNEAKPNDPIYWSKWNKEMTPLNEDQIKDEFRNELIRKDLDSSGVLDLVRGDIAFVRKYNISSIEDYNEVIKNNYEAKQENNRLQNIYDNLKKIIENEK